MDVYVNYNDEVVWVYADKALAIRQHDYFTPPCIARRVSFDALADVVRGRSFRSVNVPGVFEQIKGIPRITKEMCVRFTAPGKEVQEEGRVGVISTTELGVHFADGNFRWVWLTNLTAIKVGETWTDVPGQPNAAPFQVGDIVRALPGNRSDWGPVDTQATFRVYRVVPCENPSEGRFWEIHLETTNAYRGRQTANESSITLISRAG